MGRSHVAGMLFMSAILIALGSTGFIIFGAIASLTRLFLLGAVLVTAWIILMYVLFARRYENSQEWVAYNLSQGRKIGEQDHDGGFWTQMFNIAFFRTQISLKANHAIKLRLEGSDSANTIQIDELKSEMFAMFTELEHLDLSNCLQKFRPQVELDSSSVSEFLADVQAYKSGEKDTYLQDRNWLSGEMFKGLNSLRILNIRKNSIYEIPISIFQYLPNLKELKVDAPRVTKVKLRMLSPIYL